MKNKLPYTLSLTILLLAPNLRALPPTNLSPCREHLRNALTAYEKQQYAIAQQLFAKPLPCKDEATTQYYIAACAYHLAMPDAENLLQDYVSHFPQATHTDAANYLLAKLYFGNANYPAANAAFQAINPNDLPSNDKPEYHFKYGYSLFMDSAYTAASAHFDRIKDDSTRYSAAATYYYAHIAYEQKNYNVAATHFERLVDDETFGTLAPYYILHIAHAQHDYDKVIAQGEAFLEHSSTKRMPEIARIIGEAHYFKGEYDKALPFIEKFIAASPTLTREDRYLMGYIYYQNKQYPKASDLFQQIVAGEDSLAQMAHYYLADSRLQLNEKQKAGQAYLQASKMDFLPEIKEDAMYNYAKLMFELKSGPFTDAITALTTYLEAYPNSVHDNEAHTLLSQAYLWTRNYRAAWMSLHSVKQDDAATLAARQKIAFYIATEHIQQREWQQASAYLDTSLQYSIHSPSIAARATYWKAECEFSMKNYNHAKHLYSQFLFMPTATQVIEHKAAYYNLAYCYYKLASPDTAQKWFKRFVDLHPKSDLMLSDALCRMGDYLFQTHYYQEAIGMYQQVIQLNAAHLDYATYQSALCYGLTENRYRKLELLNKVIAWQPRSAYADNAKFEKGRTYTQMQEYDKAIAAYKDLLRNPQSNFTSKCLVELGLIDVNRNQNEDAMRYYKQVVEQYPGTPEMRTALVGIRNIYVEDGRVDDYFAYADELKSSIGISMSDAEKDSIAFAAAQHAYLEDNHDLALSLLSKYNHDYPQGAFLLEATFYLGDLYLRTNRDSAAIPYYRAVLKYQKNDYTENALDAISAIFYNQEQYSQAADYYRQMVEVAQSPSLVLKAHRGAALSAYMLKDYAVAISESSIVLDNPSIASSVKLEMLYVRAKSHEQQSGSIETAYADYILLSANPNSKEGAEAQYRLIEYAFVTNDYDKAERDVVKFSKSGTSQEYWLARCFLLLGDIYVQRGDAFQAKATYESIIGSYSDSSDGVKDAVQQRLSLLLQSEAAKDQAAADSKFEVKM